MSIRTLSLAEEKKRLELELEEEREARRLLEQRCRELQAAAQIAESAGEIAHELRNPLFSIEGFAELVGSRHPADPKVGQWVGRILEGVTGVDRVLSAMVDMSRTEMPCLEAVEAVEIIDGAESVLRAEYPPAEGGWVLSRTIEADLMLHVDSTLAKEAVLHLLRNGIEAGAGRLELTGRRAGANEAEIVVEDDGEGIPATQMARIRRLFFSTRPGADGIGLNRVEKIAFLHGGDLRLESAEEGGTRVCMMLPQWSATSERSQR